MWSVIGVIFIVALAVAINRATKGTVFKSSCGCTPNIARLEILENAKAETGKGAGSER